MPNLPIGNRITFCECNHGVKKAGGFLHRLCIVSIGARYSPKIVCCTSQVTKTLPKGCIAAQQCGPLR
jgi:hypothetical protein